MKIALMSDLHLEFERTTHGFKLPPGSNHPAHHVTNSYGQHYSLGPDLRPLKAEHPDMVILAGDIGVGGAAMDYANAVARYLESATVVLLPGNHEYYGATMEGVVQTLSERADPAEFANNTVLIKSQHGIRFLFTTLWTQYDNNPPMLNDYRIIGWRGRILRPGDTQQFHQEAVRWLDKQLSSPWAGKTVVVTHHASSLRLELQNPQYQVTNLTRAFHAELDELISHYRPEAWLFGHHHWCLDVTIDGTRFVSNQRGYPKEFTGGFDPAKIVVI